MQIATQQYGLNPQQVVSLAVLTDQDIPNNALVKAFHTGTHQTLWQQLVNVPAQMTKPKDEKPTISTDDKEWPKPSSLKPPKNTKRIEVPRKPPQKTTPKAASSTETTNIYFDNRRSSPKKSSSEEPVEKESTGESAPDEGSTEETDIYFDNRKRK